MKMKRKIGLKGGMFFYLYYLSFFFVCVVFVISAVQYIWTGEFEAELASKSLCAIVAFLGSSRFFKKSRKAAVSYILGTEDEGIKNMLSDKKLREKTERAIDLAIQFGAKKGIKRLEHLMEKSENYDDKAVLCYIIGFVWETAGDSCLAVRYYNKALQYRPYYSMALNKLNMESGYSHG